MEIIAANDTVQVGKYAAQIIGAQVINKKISVLGFSTGATPLPVYSYLGKLYRLCGLDFSEVIGLNLDEYCGLPVDNVNSYHYFMKKNLFQHININPCNTHFPNGMAKDFELESREYEAKINSFGGIDLQLIGIGHNGHIGFNEPDISFVKETHCVTLAQSTIKANARFFKGNDEVPRQAITMGICTIMKAKKILMLCTGKSKSAILDQALFGAITPKVPASVIQMHPNCTIIADEAALSMIKMNKRLKNFDNYRASSLALDVNKDGYRI